MKERPILFNGEMVRAILDGKKTQTRRVFKFRETNELPSSPDLFNPNHVTQPCPYGHPGDRLWVRESLFMPRWASRITLDVTGVRVERLQDISEEDAKSEGVDLMGPVGNISVLNQMGRARYMFAHLWDSINVDHNWYSNPWVWVVELRRVMP